MVGAWQHALARAGAASAGKACGEATHKEGDRLAAQAELLRVAAREQGDVIACSLTAALLHWRPALEHRASCDGTNCSHPELHCPLALLALLTERDVKPRMATFLTLAELIVSWFLGECIVEFFDTPSCLCRAMLFAYLGSLWLQKKGTLSHNVVLFIKPQKKERGRNLAE